MGKTTFTGPLRAGNILNTSGTTVGKDVKNVGSVVMSQTVAVTQADSATALGTVIVLPANSQITGMNLLVTTAWNGVASTLNVGTSATATELVAAGAGGTLGVIGLTAGADATRVGAWADVGTSDVQIYVLSTNTGAGVGKLTVSYIQAQDIV